MERIDFGVRECPVENVVVYLDQAEVTRTIKAELKPGETQIVLNDLSPSIDKDSIRVEGRGSAKINEVVFSSEKTTAPANKTKSNDDENKDDEAAVDEKQKLAAKERELRREQESLGWKRKRIAKQAHVLAGLAEHVSKSHKTTRESGDFVGVLSVETLAGVASFFELHKREAKRLDEEDRRAKREEQRIAAELVVIDEKLKKLKPKREEGRVKREVKILLEVEKESEVELLVSYLVKDASWSPKYDLRVFSKDKKIQINYFGIIKQCTGEEWTDANMELSTAMPSAGGMAPVLPTIELAFKSLHYPAPGYQSAKMRATRRANFERNRSVLQRSVEIEGDDSEGDELTEEMSYSPEISMPTAEVKSGITGTTFKVPRRSTIPSDDTGHKVTVAQIPLEPSFEYEAVPKLASYAFLKAKVKNTSPYSILSGPANVFLDNNFVAKSSLKTVSPKEEFGCSLGVDPAVRVVYKPAKKFREVTGFVTKTNRVKLQQHVEIKNTRADTIKITVTDQLPLSSNEKIKVTLTEPEFRKGEMRKQLGDGEFVELNKSNNLEWTVNVKPQVSHTVKMHYAVEYPQGETIQGL